MKCETVKVVKEGSRLGYHLINKSAFNPDKHELYGEGEGSNDKATEKAALVEKGVALKLGTADELGKMRIDTLRNKVAAAERAGA